MKRLIVLLTIALLALVPSVATADDEDDVIAAVLDYILGWNDGNAATIARYMAEDATVFLQGLGLMSPPFNQANLQNLFDNGLSANLSFTNLQVQVYGGDTAIFTAYEGGNITGPQGQVNEGPWRYSAVWIKEGGQWKQAHRHASPLRTGEPGQ